LPSVPEVQLDENGVPRTGVVVRGRVYDSVEKPVTFNKLWTEEEQRRLEQLLVEYPDEPVQAHRWTKIARALGNRTPKQVASRVQKFFLRLAKDGKPLPGGGRMPNLEVSSLPFIRAHTHTLHNKQTRTGT
jgi:hypothetical protein